MPAYQPTPAADRMTRLALAWWSHELTTEQREELLRRSFRLQEYCRDLGMVGMIELWFKLAVFFNRHEEGIG